MTCRLSGETKKSANQMPEKISVVVSLEINQTIMKLGNIKQDLSQRKRGLVGGVSTTSISLYLQCRGGFRKQLIVPPE